ncbi:sensor histidine kinase [Aquipuribacter nitratireducens]|uniref:histidine kinase n=1 Tax=Aquipuribacter nitratireducens TaxID=650104 RepID=A0ABW0GMG4_9MICO
MDGSAAAGRWTRALRGLAEGRPLDVAPAVVAVLATAAERLATVAVPGEAGGSTARLVAALLLAVVVGGSLAWRRTAPLGSYAVGTGALVVESLAIAPSGVSPYVNLVALVSLGWYGTARRALWGPLVALVGIGGWFARPELPAVVPITVVLVWFASWGFAYQAARGREAGAQERQRRQREAVQDERTRIARELHDVVGHALSLMLVQVGAARTVLDERPATARDMLLATERTGRDAMVELDRVLGLLRDSDAVGDPGPADLDRLVAGLADAGLHVRLERGDGVADRQSPTTDLALYRVVQESLTNALRHGGARHARVRLQLDGDDLLVEVVDDGSGPAPGWEPGRGLLGVAERVAVLGGDVEHGAGPTGGFRVAVRLPSRAPR